MVRREKVNEWARKNDYYIKMWEWIPRTNYEIMIYTMTNNSKNIMSPPDIMLNGSLMEEINKIKKIINY